LVNKYKIDAIKSQTAQKYILTLMPEVVKLNISSIVVVLISLMKHMAKNVRQHPFVHD